MLKAFANSGNNAESVGIETLFFKEVTVKGLRRHRKFVATPLELRRIFCGSFEPRVSKPTLGWN
jgi:hypothetical protein